MGKTSNEVRAAALREFDLWEGVAVSCLLCLLCAVALVSATKQATVNGNVITSNILVWFLFMGACGLSLDLPRTELKQAFFLTVLPTAVLFVALLFYPCTQIYNAMSGVILDSTGKRIEELELAVATFRSGSVRVALEEGRLSSIPWGILFNLAWLYLAVSALSAIVLPIFSLARRRIREYWDSFRSVSEPEWTKTEKIVNTIIRVASVWIHLNFRYSKQQHCRSLMFFFVV